ncbi:MAG: glycoside hydrolase family 97 protein [Saprospiraceae bacterium]|nr:glycoside hydrolase family 97 protein [Saprospiraceae bacterium]
MQLESPSRNIRIRIQFTDKIYYAIDFQGQNVMWFSPLSLSLQDGQVLGTHPKVLNTSIRQEEEMIPTVWGIRSEVRNAYNELLLEMDGGYNLRFRAYDDGVAYRFQTHLDKIIKVTAEEVGFRFLQDHALVAHVVGDFQTSYEKLYTKYKISEVVEEEFISLPLIVDTPACKLAITEADLYDYPGMYIRKLGNNNRFFLDGLFPAYPTTWEPGGLCQFNLKVTERADYLAESHGVRDFPWRAIIVAESDRDLADSDMVFKLSRPSVIETDWIKPGKVAWDWFNDWNLIGVDFETGVNNRTYEYYIDFAAQHGLEYVIMDEGWSDVFDLLLQKPTVDVPHLVQYANERNVGIVLWCVWHTLDRQMQAALDQFQAWGVVGVKVDFIDRDDQIAIDFYERLARETAKRKLLLNIHGCSKPTGLHRTYPNVINYEGVRGNEYNKFDKDETPGHNVDLAFTRMIAGPMDYTPGSMRNSIKGKFFTDYNNPMSHGTRCHQLGMYVVYYSPMQMLCDAPTAYLPYPDILSFLSEVPVTWDETIVLDGKIGEYVVIARQKGKDWYIGALTDWTERVLQLDLSFLSESRFQARVFVDGINANRHAEDYRVVESVLTSTDRLQLDLKSGGGAAIQLKAI